MRARILIPALLATALAACTQPDRPSLDKPVTDLKIVISPTETPNVYNFSTEPKDVIGFWSMGNGATFNAANEVQASYPFAGNYTVTLQGYGQGGKTNTVSVTLPVTGNNFDLLKSEPMYEMIAGELNGADGKTWVVDSMLQGHLIKNPQNGASGDWSGAPLCKQGGGLYDDEGTFMLNASSGSGFKYVNHGSSLGAANEYPTTGSGTRIYQLLLNDGAWSGSGARVVSSAVGDWTVDCIPPAGMSWSLIKDGAGYYWISFPNVKTGHGGFLFFFGGWGNNFQVRYITANRMVVWVLCADGARRQIVMIKKGTPSGLPLPSPLPDPIPTPIH